LIVTFIYPSSRDRTGGVTMLYEFANALARRGHEVHFIHGPMVRGRVEAVEEIPFRFEASVRHHLVDSLHDPRLPQSDVVFGGGVTHLGAPAVLVQGYRLLSAEVDALAYRTPTPKVCVASWLVDVGRAYGVPDHQLVHVPLGLDHERFAMRTPASERTIDVAMLFHPSPEKGWDVGRRVLEELKRRRPHLRATVITLAAPPKLAPPDGVDMVSLSQRQLVDEVYNQAKVFVQASHHEGFGLTALEAMACGAALVTTDCGGSRDYAVPDETALVVRAGDAEGLVDRVEQLLDDDARRTALAKCGADSVFTFDWARSGRLLEEFLERYVADPAAFQQPPGEDHSADFRL
jgi:glycosyltransferase involved in cell wall biosynthesis